jgi:hypothetical protein
MFVLFTRVSVGYRRSDELFGTFQFGNRTVNRHQASFRHGMLFGNPLADFLRGLGILARVTARGSNRLSCSASQAGPR